MMTLIYGSTITKGELEGFSPGSTEFEIDWGDGCKQLLTAKSDHMTKLFDRIRHSMSAVGLAGLKNSTIDFNNGSINIEDGPINKNTSKPKTIRSAFIA